MEYKIQETNRIAVNELRKCYRKNGIIAGNHHFTDFWARDGFFAALGSLTIGDFLIVEKMVKNFLKHQRNDGLIPYRIMRGPISLGKYLGRPSFYKKQRPTFKLRGFGNEVLDGTTLTLLFTAQLGLKGWSSAKKYIKKIKKALSYLESREKNGLLSDGVMAEWNDTALKFGNLLYSNIIYLKMYQDLASWIQSFDTSLSKKLFNKGSKIAESLRKKLWTGKYFADWYDYKRHDYLYPFGNCLAVTWNLTNKKESESILKQCEKVKVAFTLETNFPKYPFWRIDPFQQLGGMGDYQNQSLLWWQPGLSYLAALRKIQIDSKVKNFTKLITEKVCSQQKIYECHERNGKPVKRLYYSAEQPFAWAAGMMLWAFEGNHF